MNEHAMQDTVDVARHFVLYGDGRLRFSVPFAAVVEVLRPADYGVTDRMKRGPEGVLQHALAKPIGTARLDELAAGKRRACIVVSDNTRPVPNELVLHSILRHLEGRVTQIEILVANGLHKALSTYAIEELVGKRIARAYRIRNHIAGKDAELANLGVTPLGLPITLNKQFLLSDLRILTGLVEPHFMAGFSGGRKSVCPGIAGRKTIQGLHAPALLEDPRADFCVLRGNPVHAEALRIAEKAGVDFILNTVIDEDKALVAAAAGSLVDAWMECVKLVAEHSLVSVEEPFDVVITGNGGYPQDRNYYQTVKGLVSAVRVLKPDGILIMASECRDGLGSEDFRRCLGTLRGLGDVDAYLEFISQETNFTLDQWEVEELLKVLRRTKRILLLSRDLTDQEMDLTFAERVGSVEDGMRVASSVLGEGLRVGVIPGGPYTVGSCGCKSEVMAGLGTQRGAPVSEEDRGAQKD